MTEGRPARDAPLAEALIPGAFGDAATVLLAASTTAVAGALSMAAGACVAANSEREVARTERRRSGTCSPT